MHRSYAYLHFNSHHSVSAKRAAVRSLFDRIRNVTLRKESLQKEEEHFTTTFKQNGYLLPFIRSDISSTQKISTTTPGEEQGEPGAKNIRRKRRSNHWQSFHMLVV